jgi:hypothetical protein
MSRQERREALAQLERDNKKWPKHLALVPPGIWPEWPFNSTKPLIVMRSYEFLVQVFEESDGITRLSVNRTSIDLATLDFRQDISWDDLQHLKNEAGFADFEAVEIYPPHDSVVNVANMRHLWILPERTSFSWKRKK